MKRINIITGHYGSGKTNVAINMAIAAKNKIISGDVEYNAYKKVALVDLDIVNPYFRAADSAKILEDMGIEVTAPVFANTNLDIPSLPSKVYAHLENEDEIVFIDVGGDDSGAIALGRYREYIREGEYDLYYVINEKRIVTADDADEVYSLLRGIETASRLKCTKLINNTHLCRDTTVDIINHSFDFAKEVSDETGLPLEFHTIEEKFIGNTHNKYNDIIMPIKIYTKNLFGE